jgi:MOSC domain-containing protein YiiM
MRAMRTIAELETAWSALPAAPRDGGSIRLLCRRRPGGVHETPESAELTPAGGLVGDRWADRRPGSDPDGQTAITLMNVAVAELVNGGRLPLDAPGDNLLVDLDLSEEALPAGTRLAIGSAVLRVSETPHTGCSTFSSKFGLDALKWTLTPLGRANRLRGVNCSVVQAGTVRVGDRIEVLAPAPA